MIGRLAASGLAAALLLGCSTSDDGADAVDVSVVAPPSASAYTFELTNVGADERHPLIAPVPVGRTAAVTVSLMSLDDTIDIRLEATVLQAGADGQSQLIEMTIVGVDADDGSTVDALAPIVGASAELVRDGRLSIVEQQLDVPDGLAFRADTVARQALRAPFALVGPLALQPVGEGAEWTVETVEDDAVGDATVVRVVGSTTEGFQLRLDVPGGVAEISGRAGALLPHEQILTLDNATLTVVAERSN